MRLDSEANSIQGCAEELTGPRLEEQVIQCSIRGELFRGGYWSDRELPPPQQVAENGSHTIPCSIAGSQFNEHQTGKMVPQHSVDGRKSRDFNLPVRVRFIPWGSHIDAAFL